MTIFYIAGSGIKPGKTSFASSFRTYLSKNEKKVNILKPFTFFSQSSDPDMNYLSRNNSDTNLSYEPLVLSKELEITEEMISKVSDIIKLSSDNADHTIIEGINEFEENTSSSPIPLLIDKLNAKVILIIRGSENIDLNLIENTISAYRNNIKLILINRTPKYMIPTVKNSFIQNSQIQYYDLPIDIIPEDRTMLSPSVSEIGSFLNAKFPINDDISELIEKLNTPIEYFMIGGWSLDSGIHVFSKRNNKAVIVKGDRPDLQMAALETSTSCLILTNGQEPIQYVVQHAIKKQIPILAVNESTQEIMNNINEFPWENTEMTNIKSIQFGNLLEKYCQETSLATILEN